MIDVKSVNPMTLPSLPITMKKGLPVCPSIYFVLEGKEVVYIGRSVNLNNRWRQHHRFCQLSQNAVIAWLEVSDESLLETIEKALIDFFSPKLNGSDVSNEGKSTQKVIVAAYIPIELKDDAERLAKSQNRTLSNLVGMLLEKAVADYRESEKESP